MWKAIIQRDNKFGSALTGPHEIVWESELSESREEVERIAMVKLHSIDDNNAYLIMEPVEKKLDTY